jgi:hypothetical protein
MAQRRQQSINPTAKGIPEDIAIGLTPTRSVRVFDFPYRERWGLSKWRGTLSRKKPILSLTVPRLTESSPDELLPDCSMGVSRFHHG